MAEPPEGTIQANIKMTASLVLTTRSSFATSHVFSAAHLARAARVSESKKPQDWDPFEHRACVDSAVIMSVAFLEATINELFDDCQARPAQVEKIGLSKDAVRDAGLLWQHGVPRTAKFNIRAKYEKAAKIFGTQLDFGRRPGQDVLTVVALRNELVHAEPAESVVYSTEEGTPTSPDRFKHRVATSFHLNPHAGAGDAFFPNKMLSAGCAAWAIETCISFTDKFFEGLSIKPPYEHLRERLGV